MAIVQINSRLWAAVDYDGANVACINTEKGLVLVDTPMLPQDIAAWQVFITEVNPRGPIYTILTHHHFDHLIGVHQLGGRVIMHEDAFEEMMEEGGTLREDMAPNAPGRTQEEIDFILSQPLVEPEITFDNELSLNLGDTRLRLVDVGGHTRGSICVYLEEDRVLLSGDNVTAGLHPFKLHANFMEWIESLKWMRSLDVETVVPGHGEICRADELDRFIEYFSRLWIMTAHLIEIGEDRDQVVAQVHESMIGFFAIDPAREKMAKMIFDLGTRRLYDEILAEL
jgi:cyclase